MKMSLPKKKKKKKFFFFRETPTSPWVPIRAKFWPLGRLFRPSRPLAWSLCKARIFLIVDLRDLFLDLGSGDGKKKRIKL